MRPHDDSEWRELAAALESDRERALEGLWDLCGDQLYGMALYRTGRPEDAEDVVQEVFVRLVRKPGSLARARNPRGYLLRMTHNAAVDVVTGRRAHESLDQVADLPICGCDAGLRAEAAEATRALNQLPEAQREAVYLRHFLGLSYREIAAATGVVTFTAASRCRLGVRRLRRLLGVE